MQGKYENRSHSMLGSIVFALKVRSHLLELLSLVTKIPTIDQVLHEDEGFEQRDEEW